MRSMLNVSCTRLLLGVFDSSALVLLRNADSSYNFQDSRHQGDVTLKWIFATGRVWQMMISTGRDTLGTLPAWRLDLCTITARVLEGEVRALVGILRRQIKTKMSWRHVKLFSTLQAV